MLVMVVFFIAFRWIHLSTPLIRLFLLVLILLLMPTLDRKSGSAGMPRPISYAVFCLKKKKKISTNIKSCEDHYTPPPITEVTSGVRSLQSRRHSAIGSKPFHTHTLTW